jgi:hypothetical protein
VGFWLVDESQGLVMRQQRTEEETTKLVREKTEKARQGERAWTGRFVAVERPGT